VALDLRNCDCMELMSQFPDHHFDLAIVDPPYGIGAGSVKFINGTSKTEKPYYKLHDWDTSIPDQKYFDELFRVSKNQIIWGGNYFTHLLKPFRCFVVWDKTIHGNSYADCELAWTSFDQPARYFRENIAQTNVEGRIHPTQKSIKLYKNLLDKFAKEGDKILDTHLGSGSIAIACHDYKFDLTASEIDKEYFDNCMKRVSNHLAQTVLF